MVPNATAADNLARNFSNLSKCEAFRKHTSLAVQHSLENTPSAQTYADVTIQLWAVGCRVGRECAYDEKNIG